MIDEAGGVSAPDPESDDDPQPERTTAETRHLLFSCTKPYAAACLHHLVDTSDLRYDDRVVDHWPEFADSGTEKATVTVRHVLSHQAGLPVSPVDGEPDLWTDWDAVVEAIEEMDCAFTPGETAAYHALTFGFLVGELVRRCSGTPVGEYARRHVFDPLGMGRTSIGLPDDVPAADVATLAGFEPGERCRTSAAGLEGISNDDAAALFNRESIQRAVIPASTGVGTAREMGRFYACLANGGELDGTRLLSETVVDEATSLQVAVERDETMGVPRRYALGFERGGTPWDKYGTIGPRTVFGHGGLGSCVGWADPEADLAMAYVTNGVRDEYEHAARVNAMADAVRVAFG
ncbi:serine hydrolase domain-containing protein [Haloarculaceae archaeon H-GB2-1]|nr:serine hydrolase domain-containing protein [Haloarculaceae archaeon H-GB2-1]